MEKEKGRINRGESVPSTEDAQLDAVRGTAIWRCWKITAHYVPGA